MATDFQKKVWAEIDKIPYGTTVTYKEIAIKIGKPKAARAVANACGQNPEPITCLLYTSPSPRDGLLSRMPSSA